MSESSRAHEDHHAHGHKNDSCQDHDHKHSKHAHEDGCCGHSHDHDDVGASNSVNAMSQPPGDGTLQTLHVSGLDCADCARNLERALRQIPGISRADVNFAAARCVLVVSNQEAIRRAKAKSKELGFSLSEKMATETGPRLRLLLTIAAALVAAAGWLLGRVAPALSPWFYGAAVLVGGLHTFKAAAGSVKSRMLTVDILVTLAVAAAMITGEGLAAAEVIVLMSVGELLEERTLARTRRSVQGLLDLAPISAVVRRGGMEVEVSRDELAAGDLVVVRPGGRIAVDGVVVEGRADVSEAPITGESRLRSKLPGDQVYAGSLAEDGILVVRADEVGPDTTLARMAALIEEAQMRRAPVARQVDRFAGLFIPFTLVAAVVVGLVTREVSRSVTILIGACPCALVLATPVSVFAGIGAASKRGILIKGGLFLERLGNIRVMALDKTGTLTKGELEVEAVFPALAPTGGRECLVLAAAVEANSEHPIGRALARAAVRQGLTLPPATGFHALPGAGVRGMVDGREVRVGSRRWLEECGVNIGPEQAGVDDNLVSEGYSVVHVAVDGSPFGLIALSDALRPDAASAVKWLHDIGIETVLLSGDAPAAAARVAAAVGIANHRGGLLPAEKVRAVEELSAAGRGVAMVGDGINDAPALTAASVGVAVGHTGSDLTIEASDVVLLSNDLHRLAEMVLIGRRALANIRINLIISGLAIAGLFVAAALGLVGPAVGAIVHEGSALLVTVNAMRLVGYRAQERPSHAAEEKSHGEQTWAGQRDTGRG